MNKEVRIKNKEADARRRRAAGSPILNTQYPIPNTPLRLGLIAKRSTLNARVNPRSGFTLLELIITVSIVVVLGVALVLVVNPVDILKRARDSDRISAAETLEDALEFVKVESGGPEGGYDPDGALTGSCVGESSQTVFVSVIGTDVNGTCDAGEMPNDLPTGWSYRCAPNDGPQDVDGTGWIPIDMNIGGGQPPIERLPVDPANTFASGFYYSYICARRGDFEITMRMDADRNRVGGSSDISSTDGGDDPLVYEVGTNIKLNPTSPVAYWAFNGGTSGVILENDTAGMEDSTGNGNNGRADNNDASGMAWVKGVNAGAVDLDGADDHVDLGNPTDLQLIDSETISIWLNPGDMSVRRNPFAKAYGGEGTVTQEINGSITYYYGTAGANAAPWQGYGSNASALVSGSWSNITIVRDLSAMRLFWYVDGVYQKDGPATYAQAVASSLSAYIGRGYVSYFDGTIDEVAIYDRALSAEEISYNYKALKP